MPDDSAPDAELNSPACFAHEADAAYMGYLTPHDAEEAVRKALVLDPTEAVAAGDLGAVLAVREAELSTPAGAVVHDRLIHALRALRLRNVAPKIADETLRAALVRLAAAHERAAGEGAGG